jgi:hypothetical protein
MQPTRQNVVRCSSISNSKTLWKLMGGGQFSRVFPPGTFSILHQSSRVLLGADCWQTCFDSLIDFFDSNLENPAFAKILTYSPATLHIIMLWSEFLLVSLVSLAGGGQIRKYVSSFFIHQSSEKDLGDRWSVVSGQCSVGFATDTFCFAQLIFCCKQPCHPWCQKILNSYDLVVGTVSRRLRSVSARIPLFEWPFSLFCLVVH